MLGIGCHNVGIAECSIYVLIQPGVLLGTRDIMSNFVLWALALKTGMPLMMM
jgi:hypothetical protein